MVVPTKTRTGASVSHDPGKPGPNVGPFHWENRRLRVPELRRLFTFPEDFEFVGRRSAVQAQIGNAVPPLLAQCVTEQVALAIA